VKQLKITFDSNVWFKIADPNSFAKDNEIDAIIKLKELVEKKIIAYLSETIFSLEPIKRDGRKEKITSGSKIKISKNNYDSKMQASFVLDLKNNHPGNNPIIDKFYKKAIDIGFKTVRLPRIGCFINPDIEDSRIQLKGEECKDFFNKSVEVSEKTEGKEAPDSINNQVANAISEWADGDSVATSIGLNCDYFCTRDSAKKAEEKSVFSSSSNLQWLKDEFDFDTISPKELVEIINSQQKV
jgi:hypothetical protein